jgi:predicted nucleotidyltransferase component of viral defense system
MLDRFDRRVIPDSVLDLVRFVQQREDCHLAGGAALSGAHLAHRLSADIDLFVHEAAAHRRVCRLVQDAVLHAGGTSVVVRDGGSFWRAQLSLGSASLECDVVHESVQDIEPPPAPIEGVVVESLVDLRAAKLTCLLSRSEPRDLVDVLFLERAGFRPEDDIEAALRKDAGVDPAILAWLLKDFPVEPLPQMLAPLSVEELRAYRDDLCMRFRRLAVPGQ